MPDIGDSRWFPDTRELIPRVKAESEVLKTTLFFNTGGSSLYSEAMEDVVLVSLFGSRYVCNPPVMDTDLDYLMEVKPGATRIYEFIESTGWTLDGSYQKHMSDFTSYRKGGVNLVISDNPEFCSVSRFATQVCKALNLSDKYKRVLLYNSFRDFFTIVKFYFEIKNSRNQE